MTGAPSRPGSTADDGFALMTDLSEALFSPGGLSVADAVLARLHSAEAALRAELQAGTAPARFSQLQAAQTAVTAAQAVVGDIRAMLSARR